MLSRHARNANLALCRKTEVRTFSKPMTTEYFFSIDYFLNSDTWLINQTYMRNCDIALLLELQKAIKHVSDKLFAGRNG